MKFHRLLLGVLIFSAVASLAALPGKLFAQQKDNFGTEFYVAFGPNLGSDDTANVMDLYLTSRVSARVHVQVDSLHFSSDVTTTPGKITTITLPAGRNGGPSVIVDESFAGSVVRGMSVHITSDSAIAVFGISHKLFSSDAFMALPVNVLGTEYRALCYTTSRISSSTTPGEFWIVATQDATNVTVVPRDRTITLDAAGQPISRLLNKGDVYLVMGDTSSVINDLTGSLIESDRPIAVFSGHMRASMPDEAINVDGDGNEAGTSRDHLVEQLPPVSAWGDSAMVVPFKTDNAGLHAPSQPDLVRIVASEDNTTIKVDGNVVGTKNAGEFFEIHKLDHVALVEATNPILVGQYMHTSFHTNNGGTFDPPAYGDPALSLVFPVEQFTNSYTILSIENKAAFVGNFVNIIAPSDSIWTMTIDGTAIPSAHFKPVTGTKYVYSQESLQQGTHTIKGAKNFGVTIYGLGEVDSYAYPGGTLLKTITPFKASVSEVDFHDRALRPDLSGTFDTVIYFKNISEDTLAVYAFPKRSEDTSKFYVTEPITAPAHIVYPGVTDSMRIVFEPREIDRRQHTQIIAKTNHLRAYVVDVYGRGVLDVPAAFSDATLSQKIDTLNFGIFDIGDPARDMTAWIANNGHADLNLKDAVISAILGGDASSSFVLISLDNPDNTQTALPANLGQYRSKFSLATVRFVPGTQKGIKVARLELTSVNGTRREVVLIADIEPILPADIGAAVFPSTLVCEGSTVIIRIKNTNIVPITLKGLTFGGSNEFSLIEVDGDPVTFPYTIEPKQTLELTLHFQPADTGWRSATVQYEFDLPSRQPLTQAEVKGYAHKLLFPMRSSQHIHILGDETVLLPIYALADLGQFRTNAYTISISYDPTWIEDINVHQDATLSTDGSISISGVPGQRVFSFTGLDGATLSGGGTKDIRPLLYIEFAAKLNGHNRFTASQATDIAYDVILGSSGSPPKIDSNCVVKKINFGRITIDSVCETIHVVEDENLPPSETYVEQNTPNPFNPSTTITYGVPRESHTTLEVYDLSGKPVALLVDDTKKPGWYEARFDGSSHTSGVYYIRLNSAGVTKTRRMILAK